MSSTPQTVSMMSVVSDAQMVGFREQNGEEQVCVWDGTAEFKIYAVGTWYSRGTFNSTPLLRGGLSSTERRENAAKRMEMAGFSPVE